MLSNFLTPLRVFIFIQLSLLLFSCKDNSNEKAYNPDCIPISKDVTLISDINQINFFMEVSGSMKGFMKTTNPYDFRYLIPDLIERLSTKRKFNFYELAQKNIQLNPVSVNEAKTKIRNATYSFGETSELPVMFDSLIAASGKNIVSILLTDGIYSPREESKRTQTIPDIRKIIKKAADQGLAFACFALYSKFEKNKNVTLSPYYLFLVGKFSNIETVKAELLRSIEIQKQHLVKPTINELEIGYPENHPFYSIIPYLDNSATGEPIECNIGGIQRFTAFENISNENNLEFWIGMDLSKCPGFTLDKDYLKQNISFIPSGFKVNMTSNILSSAEFLPMVSDPTDRAIALKCTNFIKFRITEFAEDKGVINISLKRLRPLWVSNNSHSDERNAEIIREKTYGLDQIITGIEDAYGSLQSKFIFKNITFNFSK